MARNLTIALVTTVLLGSAPAHAALIDRGGGMIYDDVLDVTWLQDMDLPGTLGLGDFGRMNWNDAVAWADGLVFGGFDDWRMPGVTDTGAPGCDLAASGTDCGFNVDPATSEFAHLWYVTLGNLAFQAPDGTVPQPGWGFANKGPFINAREVEYWLGTAYAPNPTEAAWDFNPGTGRTSWLGNSDTFNVWALRDGDVAVVPVPEPSLPWFALAAVAMFAGALRRPRRR